MFKSLAYTNSFVLLGARLSSLKSKIVGIIIYGILNIGMLNSGTLVGIEIGYIDGNRSGNVKSLFLKRSLSHYSYDSRERLSSNSMSIISLYWFMSCIFCSWFDLSIFYVVFEVVFGLSS